MTMLLMLGAALLFTALVVALSVIGVLTSEKKAVGRSVAAIQAIGAPVSMINEELDRPFAERVIAPLGERMVGLGRKVTRADTGEKIGHKLDIAGNPPAWDVNRILGLKALGMGLLGVLVFLYCLGKGMDLSRVLLFTGVAAFLGNKIPDILLNNAGQKRETLMRMALPDAIDLLTISVEAGLGFDAAVARVAKNTTGPLAQEFSRLLQEMQLGIGRAEAMRAMGERTSLPDLKSFCLAMVQADNLGIPMARVLRIQSTEMRMKRRQRAEEAAQKLPVKILFPVIFSILPTVFIVVIGPVFLSMGDLFGGQ